MKKLIKRINYELKHALMYGIFLTIYMYLIIFICDYLQNI